MRFTAGDGWRYGLLGLPLAFAALPLYVILPNHYARAYGVPLAALGSLLLAARLLDAVTDPWIGRLCDRAYARSTGRVLAFGAVAAAALALGFAMLFHPPVRGTPALLAWLAAALVLTSLAYSVLSIAHQSWGAMLGGDEGRRGRVVAWREGWGLAGVLLASVLPLLAGVTVTALVLAATLALGCVAWSAAPRPQPQARTASTDWRLPWRVPRFRTLLLVFVINGLASAIAATLVLFFLQDRLAVPAAVQPLFLGAYFLSAALALPGWLALVPRMGLARTWRAGMLLAVAGFAAAAWLGEGDGGWFLGICIVCGAALGTDLALPGAMLAGEIGAAGHAGRGEGAYFGWWNFAAKLTLALAAGGVLPLLAPAGYVPGAREAASLEVLTFAYCVLPCGLKLAAAGLLHANFLRRAR
ncbi:MAG: MFS transporter [Burkholderiales bacterium]|nr:MFS transporter [Burkholderiales bacterium]